MRYLSFLLIIAAALLVSCAQVQEDKVINIPCEKECKECEKACKKAEQACKEAKETCMSIQPVAWKPLFDGTSCEHWRGYKRDAFPAKGWVIEDGCLKVQANGGGGDIITKDMYENFDLRLEWKVAKGANSGIMYGVTEDEAAPWQTGPEYQIYDDLAHNLEATSPVSSGAMYALYAPPAHKPMKAAGEWNQARIMQCGNTIKHWLNGVLLLECDFSTKDWEERKAKSKFHAYPSFGAHRKGYICLQDHGNDVWFRNIKIREIPAKECPTTISLFNGKDLSGWTVFSKEKNETDQPIWSVKDGILVCKGSPYGYIHTDKEYTNFILKLKWRFSPVTRKGGNSGVLMRVTGPDKVWPKCVEAQLHSGSAGDFWCIDGYAMQADPARTKGRNTKKTHFNENAVGEWNEYEIIVNKGDITLIVNGDVLNQATEATVVPGKIALQSEGVEIQFKDIRLIQI